MKTIELVSGLYDYVLLLTTLEAREQEHYRAVGDTITKFSKSVSLSYETILLRLNKLNNEEQFDPVYIECKFGLYEQIVSLKSIYCDNKDREKDVNEYVLQHCPTGFKTKENISAYNDDVIHYISIADEIAKEAYLCSSGDNYHPGYYSEIIIEKNQIILRQINRWNSRSIDHKNDYHLRDLEFYIPLTSIESKPLFRSKHIGRMLVNFSDNSSKNNKACGDRISQRLTEEQMKFNSEKGRPSET